MVVKNKSILFMLFMLLPTLIARASDCWTTNIDFSNPVSFTKALQSIDLIFVGEIKDKLTTKYENTEIPEFEVRAEMDVSILRMIYTTGKKQISKIQLVSSVGRNCQCKYNFKLGQKYLIYAIKTKRDNTYALKFCDNIKEVSKLNEESVIARINWLEKHIHKYKISGSENQNKKD